MIIAIADFFIFLALTFVGDHSLGSMPSFLLVWSALIVYRTITSNEIKTNELKLQLVLFLLFIPYMIFGIFRLDNYYYAFLQTVLYINVFSILHRFINNKYAMAVLVGFFITLTPLVLIFGGGNRLASNDTFIFGPNIMYRIFGLVFFAFYYTVLKSKGRKSLLLLVVFILSFICLISTGSRGAILIALMESLAVIYYFRKKKIVKYIAYMAILLLIYYVVQYWEIIEPLLGRAVYFDTENASENTRLSMYGSFAVFLQKESILPMLFGLGNNNSYYLNYYPHNIIIEFVVYHGIIFFGFITIASTAMIRTIFIKGELRFFVLIYSPIIMGSLVSGYFLDNFSIISLIFYCYLQNSDNESINKSNSPINAFN